MNSIVVERYAGGLEGEPQTDRGALDLLQKLLVPTGSWAPPLTVTIDWGGPYRIIYSLATECPTCHQKVSR